METNETNLEECGISVKSAAVILGVSPRTVWRMIADHELTAHRFRRCTRLLRSQVMSRLQGGAKVGGV
jgi:excisionase family DNA binding protein